jgi:L-ribulose-5-phosphate 3-epimerase
MGETMALKLGIIVGLAEGPEAAIDRVAALGLPTCQVGVADLDLLTRENATRLRRAAAARAVEVTTIWTHCRSGQIWDFVDGPATIGLVPLATRQAGIEALKRGADFAGWAAVPSITTHVGFLPENPGDPVYPGVLDALREVAEYCRANDRSFWFETGQETPIALLRTIEDVAADNLGVNFDPANLLMYGKANPLDALDIIGQYVRGVHAKDGEYPITGRQLGVEKPLGEGRVDFPALVAKLKALGYAGAITIEREVHGPAYAEGIAAARRLLEPLLINS